MKSLLRNAAVALFLFAIGVAAFRIGSPARVVVTWETASEVDTAGFLLHRGDSPQGPFSRLTLTPIPAQGDPLAGSTYRYEDDEVRWGQRYFYQLEELERGGARNWYQQVVEGRAGVGWTWALAAGAVPAALWLATSTLRIRIRAPQPAREEGSAQ